MRTEMAEFLSEHERFENGVLSRECAASIAVASMQRLFALMREIENEREIKE